MADQNVKEMKTVETSMVEIMSPDIEIRLPQSHWL